MATTPVKRDVLILGAGPAALAALHSFKFSTTLRPTAYDPRPTASGLWHYNPLPSSLPEDEISPLYTNLDTNIPNTLMRYTTHDWPEGIDLFPEREEVEKYLVSYSQDVLQYIKFGKKVIAVKKEVSSGKWTVDIEDRASKATEKIAFDCVLMAGGNYAFPKEIPNYPAFNDWLKSGGKSIHSKFYRDPSEYIDKTVLIVGAGASGIDISRQIAAKAKKVFWSVRGSVEADESIEAVGEIERFTGSHGVQFSGGKVVGNIDAIVWCIGYLFRRPELSLDVPVETTSGARIQNLYHHIFYVHDQTLAFLGLPQKVVPFVITQAQAAVVRRVWERRLDLPPRQEQLEWEAERLARTGDGKFHQMPNLEDAEYADRLGDLCQSASGGGIEDGEMPRWGERERWLRTLLPKIKRKFEEEKAKGKHITTVEELGFVYDDRASPREELKRMESETHFNNSSG